MCSMGKSVWSHLAFRRNELFSIIRPPTSMRKSRIIVCPFWCAAAAAARPLFFCGQTIWIAFIVLLINCTSATMECVRRPVTSVAAAATVCVVLCVVRERGKRVNSYVRRARSLMGKWQAQQWTPDYLVKNPRRTCMHEAHQTPKRSL